MADYRRLFGVEVRHEFFGGGRCDALDFAIDPASRSLVDRAGLVVRNAQDGVDCYYDNDEADNLRVWFSDSDDPFRLVFRVTARDPAFEQYTEAASPQDDLVLFLDTENPEGGSGPLHVVDRVARADFQALELAERKYVVEPLDGSEIAPGEKRESLAPRDELLRKYVTHRDKHLPPIALLIVRIGPAALEGQGPEPYRLSFDARRTIWRYHFLGPLAQREAFIQDQTPTPGDRMEFDLRGTTELPGDRVAKTFVSRDALVLRQRSDHRFQLRERSNGRGNGSGRILMRRLPVASPKGLGTAAIDGREIIVSDIYVNG